MLYICVVMWNIWS